MLPPVLSRVFRYFNEHACRLQFDIRHWRVAKSGKIRNSLILVIVGLIHLLPLSGVLGAERLGKLYGLSFAEPNLVILMRHRAVLFGLLGLFLIFAAFRPVMQPAALLAGFVSVVSFLWRAWSAGAYNEQVARVFYGSRCAWLFDGGDCCALDSGESGPVTSKMATAYFVVPASDSSIRGQATAGIQ